MIVKKYVRFEDETVPDKWMQEIKPDVKKTVIEQLQKAIEQWSKLLGL